MVSNALRSSSNLTFSGYFFVSTLWISCTCIRYGIAFYHYRRAVNLDDCDQRQVILRHCACRVKGGGGVTTGVRDIRKPLDLEGLKSTCPI